MTKNQTAEAIASTNEDNDLIERILDGDNVAFDVLVRKFGPRIHALALRTTCDPTDAEDVAQEVLMAVYQKLDSFRGEAAFSSWLYRVTANAALMTLRRRRTQSKCALPGDTDGSAIERFLIDPAVNADECLENNETDLRVQDAIAQLPAKFRMVLVLKDIEGLSNEEVSEIVNLSLPATKSRLHRARLLLREKLSEQTE